MQTRTDLLQEARDMIEVLIATALEDPKKAAALLARIDAELKGEKA